MYKDKKILGIITARGGSKGIPKKNIKNLAGKPLIAYTIEAAKKSALLTRCIVSTDSEEIADIAREYGADIPFIRPDDLAQDNSTSIDVVKHALNFLKNYKGEEYDYLMILQPTSPLRSAKDIDECVKKIVDTNADSVMSMFELVDFSLKKLKKIENDIIMPIEEEGKESSQRQDLTKLYKRNCAIYLTKTDLIMQGDLFGKDSRAYVMPEKRSIDINKPIDFEIAEFFINKINNKILCTIGKKYTEKAESILEEMGEVDCMDLTRDELEENINNYNILVVGLGLNIDKKIIDKAENLKIIATATTGLDHIDVEYAREKEIEIISLKGEDEFLNTITGTAELAFGMIINLLRLNHSAFNSVKNYEWDREKFRGHNLSGQTLGIVGLGRLGKMMKKYGEAFGMDVIFYDPYKDGGVSFNELLEKSDIISIHVHLNSETENMFNIKAFEKMKNTAILINTARGKIVNENDLLHALENKIIAGYGTDVLADELEFDKTGFFNHNLVEYSKINNNIIILPHIGGMTHESREATDIFIAEKIKNFVN
ncbi:MAG: NAD(P)-dependent oxidoreductase [Candidatus Falkowbacteria bacterium]